jgi:23S rRNA U2552 (ribose-2'-O)-methylase RlmE/FtsJ
MGGINMKGISNTVMETEGTVILKLFTDTHETNLKFIMTELFGMMKLSKPSKR